MFLSQKLITVNEEGGRSLWEVMEVFLSPTVVTMLCILVSKLFVTPNMYSFMYVNHPSVTWFKKEAISVVSITHALNSDRTGFESQFLPSLR